MRSGRGVHVVGLSMGGMIAQEVALAHPDRVASLTLMWTSSDAVDPELPSMTSMFFFSSLLQGIPLFKYRLLGGERNLVKERIAKTISATGDGDLDLREMAEVVIYDLRHRRGVNLRGVIQHQVAVSSTKSRYEGLRTLDTPTLVVHGTTDRFLPLPHAEKLAELIPDAEALWLEGVGHVFPYPDMGTVTRRILSHMEAAGS
jgi:pimeloyl-ACP methyl ester carboxylesterase